MRNGEIRWHFERAGIGLQLAANERQQTRFTTAVLACDSNFLAPEQSEAGAGEQNTRSASYGDIGEVEHAVARAALQPDWLDAAQMFKPPSLACESISSSSLWLNCRLRSAPRLSSICAQWLAPISALVTTGFLSTQAMAICARLWPRRCAISFNARTFARFLEVRMLLLKEPSCAAGEESGTPLRSLWVSRPCASGEKAMQPRPSASSTAN